MTTKSGSKSERLKKSLQRSGLYLPHGYQLAARKKRKTTVRKKTVRKKR